MFDELSIPSGQRGHPGRRCKWLFADKGYDAEAQPKPKPGLSRLLMGPRIGSAASSGAFLGWLNENRRIVTRFNKLAKSYAAMVSVACSASDEYSEVSHSSGCYLTHTVTPSHPLGKMDTRREFFSRRSGTTDGLTFE